jgi:TPR repeat protein
MIRVHRYQRIVILGTLTQLSLAHHDAVQSGYGKASAHGRPRVEIGQLQDPLYGVPLDLMPEFMRQLRASVDLNSADSQFARSEWMSGRLDDSPVVRSMVQFFKRVADQNHPFGQFQYGTLLADGRGVPKDVVSAVRYYKLAADQNDVDAQVAYAQALSKGEGVAIDLVSAARYFKLAADQNDSDGQVEYGRTFLMVRVFHKILFRQRDT